MLKENNRDTVFTGTTNSINTVRKCLFRIQERKFATRELIILKVNNKQRFYHNNRLTIHFRISRILACEASTEIIITHDVHHTKENPG